MSRHVFSVPRLTALLVALAGFMSLAQVLTVRIHHHVYGRIDDSLLPISAAQSSRLLILAIGILLLYLSLQIWRRKLLAWQLVSAGLPVLMAAEIVGIRNDVQLVFYAIVLGLLIGTRAQYTVETNNLSLRRGVVTSAAIIAVVFVYATIGFTTLERREVGTAISLPSAAKYAAREIFTFQETQLKLHSRHAKWFVGSVNAASVLAYTLALFSLFRPLRFQYGPTRAERARARAILEKYANDTEEFFKLWPPDKHFFFSPVGYKSNAGISSPGGGESFIAYKVIGSDALVLGSPSGDCAGFKQLVAAFEAFAARNGWTPTYVYADARLQKTLSGAYSRIFIGNEAVLDIGIFAAETYRNKHFRYVRNKAERDGLVFDYWQQPLSTKQIDELQDVSDEWLSSGGRREYTFAMGYFDREYLRSCDAAVLSRDGRVVAYANVIPEPRPLPNRSIDHMRHRRGLPQTGMHYLLMQLILRLHEAGVRGFNLGLVPLAGIEERVDVSIAERLLAVLKNIGARYYSSEGLEQFKNKFAPDWQPRYLYYQGPPPRLLKVAGSLNRALSLPVAGLLTKRILVAVSVLAAVCYNSFFLAYFLNPGYSFNRFVSRLGAAGQSYAGLYNGLDIASGLLMLGILGFLWQRFNDEVRPYRQPMLLLAASASAIILAAVTPLPHLSATGWLQYGLHGFFSAAAGAGIGLMAVWFAAHRRHWWPLTLLIVYILSLSGWTLYLFELFGPILQYINILAMSLWMVTATVYFTGMIKGRPVAAPAETAPAGSKEA